MQIWYEVIFKNGKVHCFDDIEQASTYCENKKVERCVCFQADDDYSNSKFYTVKLLNNKNKDGAE